MTRSIVVEADEADPPVGGEPSNESLFGERPSMIDNDRPRRMREGPRRFAVAKGTQDRLSRSASPLTFVWLVRQ